MRLKHIVVADFSFIVRVYVNILMYIPSDGRAVKPSKLSLILMRARVSTHEIHIHVGAFCFVSSK